MLFKAYATSLNGEGFLPDPGDHPNLFRGYPTNSKMRVNKNNNYYYDYPFKGKGTRILLKPNTEYTVTWNYEVISGGTDSTETISVGRGNEQFDYAIDTQTVAISVKKITIKTPADVSDNPYFALRFSRTAVPATSVIDYWDIAIREGNTDYVWSPSVADVATIVATMPYIGYAGFEATRPSDFVWYARQFIQPTNVDEIGNILHHPPHYYMSRIPKYYRLSNVANALLHMEGDAHDNFEAMAKDIIDNSFVNTATWGLDIIEALCGITTDPSKPLEDRRAVLRTRYIGNTTGTKKYLQLVATRFVNGEITVENVPNEYTLNIKFVSTKGVPRNLNDIKQALEDAAPAHYKVNFKFLYLTWDELSGQNYSWDTWSGFNLEWQQVSRV